MKRKVLFSIIAIIIGIFFVVYGGYDDSPGAQLLGLVLILVGIWKLIKKKNKV